MIKSFKDSETEKIFNREFSPIIPQQLLKKAHNKLLILNAATTLRHLQNPPGNQLKKLKGKRKHQFSIRINNQYRICFHWINNQAYQVEITDYH